MLGVGTHSWEQCNRVVEIFLLSDWIKEFKDAVSTVLSQDRRVLVYSGKEDFICNYRGGQEWVNATKWDGFNAAPYKDWHVDGKVAGEPKSYDKLTFLQVEGAGHMVPKDQPESALDMLKRFLSNNHQSSRTLKLPLCISIDTASLYRQILYCRHQNNNFSFMGRIYILCHNEADTIAILIMEHMHMDLNFGLSLYEHIQHPSLLQDQHPQRCGLWLGLPPLHPYHTS